jgi:hypothetical protein
MVAFNRLGIFDASRPEYPAVTLLAQSGSPALMPIQARVQLANQYVAQIAN